MRECLTKQHLLFLSILISSVLCLGVSLGSPGDLIGIWGVSAELVVQPSEDPYAPRPGTIQEDTWAMGESAEGLTLSSSKGSCSGQYTDKGAVFEFSTPIVTLDTSYTYCLTHIECYPSGPAAMYGTLENHYRTYNYLTGATLETGLEAWKFRAVKS